MLKDIPKNIVTDVGVAIIQSDEDFSIWDAYLLNLKSNNIQNILITTKGYGEDINSSSLRFFHKELEANSYLKIESLREDLLGLTNEYWLSFYENGVLYDRKFIFLPDSIINSEFLSEIPLLNKRGSLIK